MHSWKIRKEHMRRLAAAAAAAVLSGPIFRRQPIETTRQVLEANRHQCGLKYTYRFIINTNILRA